MRLFFHIAELPPTEPTVSEPTETRGTPFAFLLTVQQEGSTSFMPFLKWIASLRAKGNAATTAIVPEDVQEEKAWKKLGDLAELSRFVDNNLKNKSIFATPFRLSMADLQWLLLEIPEVERQGVTVLVPRTWDSERKRPRSLQGAVAFEPRGGNSEKSPALGIGRFSLRGTFEGQSPLSHEEMERLLAASSDFVWLDGGWVHFSSAKMRSTIGLWQNLREQYGDEVRVADALRVLAKQAMRSLKKGTDLSVRSFTECDLYPDTVDFIFSEDDDNDNKPKLGGSVEEKFADAEREKLLSFLQAQRSRFSLHPYQVEGCLWLIGRYRMGLGAILADDMGLGKTLQTIATLLYFSADETGSWRDHKQVLIVAPTSLLYNWQREFQKFAPGLCLGIAHGSYGFNFDLQSQSPSLPNILVTSYGTLIKKIDFFQKLDLFAIVADEAQTIKNKKTLASQVISSLGAEFRIALTGTPIENSVQDVLSLVDFVFGVEESENTESPPQSEVEIAKSQGTTLDSYDAEEQQKKFHRRVRSLLRPLLLRRMKSDPMIGICLPERSEKKYFINLSSAQIALYHSLVERFRKELSVVASATDQTEESKEVKRRGLILATLIRLRQVCCDPRLVLASLDPMHLGDEASRLLDSITSAEGHEILTTGKFAELRRLLNEVVEQGEKVVVFSQFLGCLETLSIFCSSLNVSWFRVDGSLSARERTERIDLFQAQAGSAVLLLSLKAGGVGLNLTAANHVVHFDRWWNPAIEDQASDRVYRIGQKRNVRVSHLIARGTIEEGMDRLLETKRELAKEILTQLPESDDGAKTILSLSDAELFRVLQPD